MAKSMRVESNVDRISALPNELLCQILSLLPIKMAVSTSILSKRWRHLYTLISSIDIESDTSDCDDPEKLGRFMNFVENIVHFRSRPSIQRFRLKWYHYVDPLHITGWVDALMCHNIQELELYNGDKDHWPYDLQLPASLFSCATLVALKLVTGIVPDGCSPKIPARVSLPNLKVLHIEGTTILADHAENLLSSCPVLDELVLYQCYIFSKDPFKLNISNATLKRLTLYILASGPGRGRDIQVMVNAPALQYLNYRFEGLESFILLAKQSLVEVAIDGYYSHRLPSLSNAHDVLKEIENIQSLQIQDISIQRFCDHNIDLPLFIKLTYLKIHDWGVLLDLHCLEYLLAQCVVLETLVFEQRALLKETYLRRRTRHFLQQSRLTGLLCHLKRIEIYLLEIKDAEVLVKIIKFFLDNAKVLEELTVLVVSFLKRPEIMREIFALPSLSKKCRMILGDRKSVV